MPRSRKKSETPLADLRQLVMEAADRLDSHGEPEFARAVRDYLDRTTYVYAGEKKTLPLWVSRMAWERAQRDTAAQDSSIEKAVEAGFEAFLAGRFQPKRQPRESGSDRAPKSTRARGDLRQQVTAYAEAHADELGWAPSPSQVAALWLEALYSETP